MNKLVYLFELDSVIKHSHELNGVAFTPGVHAMFDEIIKSGNSVAITMNQLTDSQFIKEVIEDDVAYDSILRLFELGAIRVSLYGNIRTASQYMQNAISKCLAPNEDGFIFSNLPVKASEKELLEYIKSALIYSDLSALQEIINTTDGDEKKRLTCIYRFVKMILQVSVCETSNISPKHGDKKSFEEFMSIIMNILDEYDFKDAQFNKHIKSANLILKEKNEQLVDGRCNRSNWLDENAADLPALLANKIIHICYNYTVEDSINNVLKHYDENSFLADFINRVKLYCLLDSSSEPREYDIVTKKEWNILVRFAEYKSKAKTSDSGSATYERIYLDERRKWKKFFFMQTLKSIGLAFIYALLFLVVELGLSLAESSLSFLPESAIISSITSVLLIGVLGSLINYLLKHFNRGNDIPDILENIVNIFIHFIDLCRVLGGKNNAYRLP